MLAVMGMAGCGAGDDRGTGAAVVSASSAVTNAAATSAYPEVVSIDAPGGTCTGTVLAPDVVLTAAHCTPLFSEDPSAPVFVDAPAGRLRAVTYRVHPNFDPFTGRFDVALLRVEGRVAETAASIATTPAAAEASVLLVGFGRDAKDGTHRKRVGWAKVASLSEDEITLAPGPSLPCFGDSGGPAFDGDGELRKVVAVMTAGDASCGRNGYATRLDAIAPFTASALRALSGARGEGEACLTGAGCVSGQCLVPPDAPAHGYCTRACSSNADCATSGMACAPTPTGSRCAFPQPSPGALDGPCTSDGDCQAGACVPIGGGRSCLPLCAPTDPTACAAGRTCTKTDGALSACVLDAKVEPDEAGCGFAPSAGSNGLLSIGSVVGLAAALRWKRRRPTARSVRSLASPLDAASPSTATT
jgi:hypothetical protein